MRDGVGSTIFFFGVRVGAEKEWGRLKPFVAVPGGSIPEERPGPSFENLKAALGQPQIAYMNTDRQTDRQTHPTHT